MSSRRRSCIGASARWLREIGRYGRIAVDFVDDLRSRRGARGAAPGRDRAGLDRNAGQPAVDGDRHRRRSPRSRTAPAPCCAWIRTVGDAGLDPAARARRRHRHAFGDQIPQRPQRRDRRRAGDRARRRALGSASAKLRGQQRRRCSGRSRPGCCCAACARCIVRVRARLPTAQRSPRDFAGHPARGGRCSIPGLPSHPGHAVAARQMSGGFGGMLSIRVKGGERRRSRPRRASRLWKRATSLGGVESLIEHRASIEGAGSPCPGDLLRLSVRPRKLPTSFISTSSRALARLGGMKPVAVAIICKTPIAGRSKTRLSPPLRPEECAEHIALASSATLRRTIAAWPRTAASTGYAVYTPRGSEAALRPLLPAALRVDSAERGRFRRPAVARAPTDLLAAGICRRRPGQFGFADFAEGDLARRRSMPCAQGDNVVLSPACDGGYTLIGLSRPHAASVRGHALEHRRGLPTDARIARARSACRW